jgi:hypothetical protein
MRCLAWLTDKTEGGFSNPSGDSTRNAEDNANLSAAVVFSEDQQQCLEQLAPTLQRQTSKTTKPLSQGFFSLVKLADCPSWWMVWLSVSETAMSTIVQGLRRFEAMFIGRKTALGGLVCTP